MARYSLQFLNAWLKNDAAGMAFLKNEPQKNGAPAGWLQMETRPGIGAAPTVESLAVEVAQRGFEHLPAVLAARVKQPGFKPAEMDVYLWAQALLEAGKMMAVLEKMAQDRGPFLISFLFLTYSLAKSGLIH